MSPPREPPFESLSYTHEDLPTMFHLDRLLDRMATLSSLAGQAPRTRELGVLTSLPPELLITVLEHLSVIDLMRFRRCNRSSSNFVDTIPLLRSALRVAPNTVKGMMAIQITAHITVRQLHRKLCQIFCDGCRDLAAYIYLPTCSRACFNCVRRWGSGSYSLPYFEEELIKRFEFGPDDRAMVPSYRFIPATFTNGLNKFKVEGRHILYDGKATERMKREKYGAGPHAAIDKETMARWAEYLDHEYDMLDEDPTRADVTVVSESVPELLRMHMCVVNAPWLDLNSSQAVQGFFCRTCLYTKRQHQLYNRETFLEHLGDCRIGPFEDVPMGFHLGITAGLFLAEESV